MGRYHSTVSFTNNKKLQWFDKNDPLSRTKFIESHMSMVFSLARKYENFNVEYDDLVQEGVIWLAYAADKFDFERGTQFSTYAVPYISKGMRDIILHQSLVVRKPNCFLVYSKSISRAYDELSVELRREPSYTEIAKKVKMRVETVVQMIQLLKNDSYHGNKCMMDDGDDTVDILDMLSDPDRITSEVYDSAEMVEMVQNLLNQLKPMEREVLEWRYGFKDGLFHTFDEIGKMFGYTGANIRGIERRVFERLRKSDVLEGFSAFDIA